MDKEIKTVIEEMCFSGYWPQFVTEEETESIFFLSDCGKIIQYFKRRNGARLRDCPVISKVV